MRFTLFLFSAFCFLTQVRAQPVLNNTYLPQVGKAFSGRSFNIIAPLTFTTGANQTWDFTVFQPNYINDYSFGFRAKGTAGTEGALQFPQADLCIVSYFGSDSIENFHQNSGTDLLNHGFKIKGIDWTEKYSTPRVDFRSGLEFEEFSFRQAASIEVLPGVDPRYYKYYDTIQYAGYGTVVTSFGTYTNVPLLKRGFAKYFAPTENGDYQPQEYYKEWSWYLPGYGVPYIRYAQSYFAFEPQNLYFDGYIGFIPAVGVADNFHAGKQIVSPTLTRSGGWLQVSEAKQKFRYRIVDSKGLEVAAGESSLPGIQLPHLAAGLYQVAVSEKDGPISVTRFVVE